MTSIKSKIKEAVSKRERIAAKLKEVDETIIALYEPDIATSKLTRLLNKMDGYLGDPELKLHLIKKFKPKKKYFKNMLFFDEKAFERTLETYKNYKKSISDLQQG